MATESQVVKRKLHDLRVIDLKAELESRQLDKTGVKAVLLERLQQALQKEGHDPDDYYFEVDEVMPTKKPSKRTTTKKLARDDESETHSNVDESQNDLTLEDEEKIDSDEDRIDEKVLESTDTTEYAIDLSIEEEEKILTDEEDNCMIEKEEQANNSDDDRSKRKSNGDDNLKGSSAEHTTPKSENNSIETYSTTKDATDSDPANNSKREDHLALVVNVDDAQNDLDVEMSSPGQKPASGDGEEQANGENDVSDSKTESNSKSSSTEEGQSKAERMKDADNASNKGDESESSDKGKLESKSTAAGDKKQEDDKSNAPSSSKAKSLVTSVKEGKTIERPKTTRPVSNGRNLWVTGLSSNTRATDIKSLFSKHGKVVGAKIVSNARSSTSRCYGFVTMATPEEASKCIQHLHRTELHGRMISVERAKTEPVGPSKKSEKLVPIKKVPEKKEITSPKVEDTKLTEKEIQDDGLSTSESDKKKEEEEKEKELDVEDPSSKEDDDKAHLATGSDETQDEAVKKEDIKERKDVRHRSRQDSLSHRSSKERAKSHERRLSRERQLHHHRPLIPFKDRKFIRRPFIKRPLIGRPRKNPLTFHRIRAERLRQRQREEERELRDAERRRRQDIVRQREVERKQREEAMRLERERERLRIERERLERERAEVLRLEREKQRLERERIEREREELRRRERMSRMDDHRRPMKRSFDNFRGGRDMDFEDRKRPYIGNNSRRGMDTFDRKSDRFGDSIRRDIGRRDSSLHDRDSRSDRFERGPIGRDTDLRGHGREDRSMFRDGGDSMGQSRPTPKDDWKGPPDRRGHHGVSRDRGDRFDSGKGMSGNDSFMSERSGDSWHGSVSQSDSRGGGSKPYSSSSGIASRDSWSNDRKSESQSWGQSEGVQSDRWGSSIGGGSSSRGQQSMSQSMLTQPQSAMFESSSGSGAGGISGLGTGSSSYNSDRFDAYKSMSSMRRF